MQEWVSQQAYPSACLYVVATPIGNRADITLRALHVLGLVDTIACEDTRHTQSLLRGYGLHKPLLALHQHNESQASARICGQLAQGQRIAYVSDAGTPGISDPGAGLVRAVRAQGFSIMPIPGVSSLTTALSVSGIDLPAGQGFRFLGFVPSHGSERQRFLEALMPHNEVFVFLEAPHRLEALAQALQPFGHREVTLARELTKQFEQIVTQPAHALVDWLAANSAHRRGEFVVILHALPSPIDADHIPPQVDQALHTLLPHVPLKVAVALTVELTGHPKNAVYNRALLQKKLR